LLVATSRSASVVDVQVHGAHDKPLPRLGPGSWVLNELVNLEHQIPNSFLLHTTLLAVLFDLDEAYDTNWRYDILRNIHRWNLRGRLPLFISNFPKTVTSVSALAMFFPPDTSKKWSATGICVKCYPFLNFYQWDSKRVWSVCVNVAVCRQRRHFLWFSGNLLHRTQVTIRSKSSLTLAQEKGFSSSRTESQCVHLTRLRGYILTPPTSYRIVLSHLYHPSSFFVCSLTVSSPGNLI
jgi:hypothetical protein